MKKIVLVLFAFTIAGVGSLISYNQSTKEKQENIVMASMNQSDIPLNHNWVITFDKGINQDIINEKSIYVLDEDKNKVSVIVEAKDSTTMLIKPPSEGYLKGKSYDIYFDRDLDLEHVGNQDMPKQYRIHFSTINNL
ncbi:Ig-like domain-containing protein [Psychrobacillus sp. NPDC096623]|uniref:Ig-like domain-containing protein n=1 Tax=Psychrobacillus sp. NPDC096623 TaxID=3364492 RepID=UPI0037F64955